MLNYKCLSRARITKVLGGLYNYVKIKYLTKSEMPGDINVEHDTIHVIAQK